MSFALSVILKTTIILATAGLITLGLRRASASARHTVWAVALFATLILPVGTVFLPPITLPVLPEGTVTDETPDFGFVEASRFLGL
jgi:low temperature requirement protein LtrA